MRVHDPRASVHRVAASDERHYSSSIQYPTASSTNKAGLLQLFSHHLRVPAFFKPALTTAIRFIELNHSCHYLLHEEPQTHGNAATNLVIQTHAIRFSQPTVRKYLSSSRHPRTPLRRPAHNDVLRYGHYIERHREGSISDAAYPTTLEFTYYCPHRARYKMQQMQPRPLHAPRELYDYESQARED